jgi:hypothetical protein
MKRRLFLKASALAAPGGVLLAQTSGAGTPVTAGTTTHVSTPAVLRAYTASGHRKRLLNIDTSRRAIRACLLKQYLPMVEEGTWAWLEIHDSDLFTSPLPENVVASVFANRELFLVLANYGSTPKALKTWDQYVLVQESDSVPTSRWNLEERSLVILRRYNRTIG